MSSVSLQEVDLSCEASPSIESEVDDAISDADGKAGLTVTIGKSVEETPMVPLSPRAQNAQQRAEEAVVLAKTAENVRFCCWVIVMILFVVVVVIIFVFGDGGGGGDGSGPGSTVFTFGVFLFVFSIFVLYHPPPRQKREACSPSSFYLYLFWFEELIY